MILKKYKHIILISALLLFTILVGFISHFISQEYENSRLIKAIKRNDFVGVCDSLARGANPNAKDRFYEHIDAGDSFKSWLQMRSYSQRTPTPLIVALDAQRDGPFQYRCLPENLDLIRALLDKGADPNAVNYSGFTPLQLSANCGRYATLKLLLERKESLITQKDIDTSLLVAIGLWHPKEAKLLLEHGARVNFQNEYGNTPLIVACYTNQSDIVKQLLTLGANPKIKNKLGVSTYSIAERYKLTEIYKLLR